MRRFVMLPEPLAMIRRDRDEAGQLCYPEIQKLTDLSIDERNFPVVRAIAIVAAKRLRWIVWSVRIEEMYPQKKWSLLSGGAPVLHPAANGRKSLVGAALRIRRNACRIAAWKAIIVQIESSSEAESAIEWKPGNKRGSLVTAGAKALGKRWNRVAEHELRVVPHAVPGRRETGEDRRV